MAARAISGTRRAFKELVDGTIRVQVDVDPECRRDFLRMFPDIDTRVALAPIKAQPEPKPDDAPKGGELARLAGIMCGDPEFQAWLEVRHSQIAERAPVDAIGADIAAHIVRALCGVKSRAELDHNPEAARIFHAEVRQPWTDRRKA